MRLALNTGRLVTVSRLRLGLAAFMLLENPHSFGGTLTHGDTGAIRAVAFRGGTAYDEACTTVPSTVCGALLASVFTAVRLRRPARSLALWFHLGSLQFPS